MMEVLIKITTFVMAQFSNWIGLQGMSLKKDKDNKRRLEKTK